MQSGGRLTALNFIVWGEFFAWRNARTHLKIDHTSSARAPPSFKREEKGMRLFLSFLTTPLWVDVAIEDKSVRDKEVRRRNDLTIMPRRGSAVSGSAIRLDNESVADTSTDWRLSLTFRLVGGKKAIGRDCLPPVVNYKACWTHDRGVVETRQIEFAVPQCIPQTNKPRLVFIFLWKARLTFSWLISTTKPGKSENG